ncbi:hypothetical protein [Thermoplasma acidophilum]|uniref:OB domain-containing protein n=1 Tax=Thermoplasma acidophilum (strain ATCC 25905 / DSM 1728 / JCM 9062 / NBRC 15155 / AMRC-C165) TaxID=273075 RepID=Q9HL43_THEAC|nr:RPA family protein [Thermoplasma acidophilum]MCY0851308.1 RPA family protein [Thermoplasma acidophilum]CAC11532.1 hypothetical protein [Thermoplasma acidophilum]
MMHKRDQDYWIFSAELRDAKVKDDQSSKPQIVTPLGISIKRILCTGTVTSKQGDDRMTRITVADPVGNFYVIGFSNGFNPEEKAMLDKVSVDDRIMVIGKISSYRNTEGNYLFSIRPELVSKIDDEAMKFWSLKAYYFAKRRYYAIREAQKSENPAAEILKESGYTMVEAEAAMNAINNFPNYDYQKLFELIEPAMSSIGSSGAIAEARSMILDYIKNNDLDGKGCRYEDIVVAAKNAGIDQSTVDEILNSLGSLGEIFEVSLKRYKFVDTP